LSEAKDLLEDKDGRFFGQKSPQNEKGFPEDFGKFMKKKFNF
jgi:hypothetical protein